MWSDPMGRVNFLVLSAAMLLIYGLAYLTDLDLGGFGLVLPFSAVVFAITGLAIGKSGDDKGR